MQKGCPVPCPDIDEQIRQGTYKENVGLNLRPKISMKHQIRSYVQHGEAGRRNKSSMACDKGHPLIFLLESECVGLVALHPGLDAH